MDQKILSNDLKFQIPFCAVIAGQSGSGKTSLLIKILLHQKDLFHPNPASVLYCYGHYNSAIPQLQKMGVTVSVGIPTDEQIKGLHRPALLLLDDLMMQLNSKREILADWFTRKSHHENLSIIFLVQNLFEKSMKIVRDNSHYIILLNSPSAALQIRSLGQQVFPGNLKFFMSSYKQAVSDKKFGYLLIDLHPVSDSRLRLRTSLFKENDFQTVFIPF
jgi:hypothetical protein